MAVAEMQRWEIYLERRVQAKGWDGQLLRRAPRRLPMSVPQAHRWYLVKVVPQSSHCICKAGRGASC